MVLGKATSDYWNRLLAGLAEEVGFDLLTRGRTCRARPRRPC